MLFLDIWHQSFRGKLVTLRDILGTYTLTLALWACEFICFLLFWWWTVHSKTYRSLCWFIRTCFFVIEDECYILLRISDVYCVEHSRTFENRLKITLGRISSHDHRFSGMFESIENWACNQLQSQREYIWLKGEIESSSVSQGIRDRAVDRAT